MKKNILALLVLSSLFVSLLHAAIPERYVRSVEKISENYNSQMRIFLRTLNPRQTQFSLQQQQEYCAIVNRYVQDLYQVTNQYRADLPLSYANMTKESLVQKVMMSKEMQILKKYNIQCNF